MRRFACILLLASSAAYGQLSNPLNVPTGAPGTSDNTVASTAFVQAAVGALDVASINYACELFSGSTLNAKVQACLNLAIVSGATADARGLPGTYKTTATITVGDVNGDYVKLIPPTSGQWQGGMTDGTSVVLLQYPGTSIEGDPAAGPAASFALMPAAESNLGGIYKYAAGGSGAPPYFHLSGISILNVRNGAFTAGAPLASGAIPFNVVGAWDDASTIDHVLVYDTVDNAINMAYVSGGCCGARIANSSFNGGGQAGAAISGNVTGVSSVTTSGGLTLTTYTLSAALAASPVNRTVVIAGDTAHAGNNGSFICDSYTSTTLVLENAGGVVDSFTGTATSATLGNQPLLLASNDAISINDSSVVHAGVGLADLLIVGPTSGVGGQYTLNNVYTELGYVDTNTTGWQFTNNVQSVTMSAPTFVAMASGTTALPISATSTGTSLVVNGGAIQNGTGSFSGGLAQPFIKPGNGTTALQTNSNGQFGGFSSQGYFGQLTGSLVGNASTATLASAIGQTSPGVYVNGLPTTTGEAPVTISTTVATWQPILPLSGGTMTGGLTTPSVTITNPYPVGAGGGEYPFLEGTGTTTADISGNGNTLTFATGSNATTWTTYGIAFSSTGTAYVPNQYLPTSFTNFGTIYIAACTPAMVQTTGTSTGSTPVPTNPTLFGTTAASSGVWLQGTGSPATGQESTFTSVQPTILQAGQSTPTSLLSDAYGGCHVYGFSMGTSGGAQDLITVDGQTPTSYVYHGYSSTLTAITGGTYNLGWGGTSGTGHVFRGVMTYVVVYPYGVAHTATQMANESAYIQAKLNLRGTYPVYPTYSNARTPQLLGVGDSLTAGYEGSDSWFKTAYMTLNNSYTLTDLGIGGLTALDMCKLFDQRVAPYIVQGQTTIVLWGGTNDLSFGGTNASIWTSLSSCVSKAHKSGARIGISTMIDRAGFDTPHDALNATIREGYHTWGFDFINDLAMVPGLGADTANTNTACFNSDRVHLTPSSGALLTGTCGYIGSTQYSGYGLVATVTANSINTADGSSQAYPDQTVSNAFTSAYSNNYVIQTPTAAATYTLVDCQGQGTPRTIVNGSGTYSITVSAVNSQTIVGSTSIATNAIAVFQPVLLSTTTAGCEWVRVQ